MKNNIKIFLAFLITMGFTTHFGFASDLFIAPGGSDTNSGTKEKPFATLEKARDTIRQTIRDEKMPDGGITVYLREGKYFRETPFKLTQFDSGKPDKPIIYAAYGNKTARLIGGTEIDPAWFGKTKKSSPVWNRLDQKAKGNLYQVNLKEHGIKDLGQLRIRGFANRNEVAPLELIFNNQTMQLARWPNQGFAKTTSAKNDIQFGYKEDRPARWVQANDPWVFGYFRHGWADEYQPIQKIDTNKKTITLKKEPNYGIREGKGWYALNLLEEIDSPGEYYVDRESGILYFWPPKELKAAEMFVSILGENNQPILDINKASYITFKNINFEVARFDGIQVEDGEHIIIDGGTIRNLGCRGADIDGFNCGIRNCEIYEVGSGGAVVSGGNRHQLIPCNNFIYNNHIHQFSQWTRTYTPAIRLSGVGCIAAHNRVHDGPHSGIMYGGNEHLIEFNDVSRCCKESDDAGAFYAGRDWGERGNVIRYNFFHHIKSTLIGSHGVHAVYLDDCLSGTEVTGNVFYKISGRAIMCGGGRDNIITNNIIVECGSAHFTDRRGLAKVNEKPGDSWNLLQKIERYNYTQPPWSTQYPKLAIILDDGYEMAKNPEGCLIRNNIGWKNEQWLEENCWGACGGFDFYTIEHNIEDQNPLFVDLEDLNLQLRPESPAYSLPGFEKIPFEAIGRLKNDQSRVLYWHKEQ